MSVPSTDTPGVRRPTGVSRLGLVLGSLATAGTLAIAFVGLGGPPAAPATVALGDATGAAAQQVVVKTIYIQLPSPTAAPVATVPTAVSSVVTRQSGSGGGEGGEHEGND
jgi:hypothetical protein